MADKFFEVFGIDTKEEINIIIYKYLEILKYWDAFASTTLIGVVSFWDAIKKNWQLNWCYKGVLYSEEDVKKYKGVVMSIAKNTTPLAEKYFRRKKENKGLWISKRVLQNQGVLEKYFELKQIIPTEETLDEPDENYEDSIIDLSKIEVDERDLFLIDPSKQLESEIIKNIPFATDIIFIPSSFLDFKMVKNFGGLILIESIDNKNEKEKKSIIERVLNILPLNDYFFTKISRFHMADLLEDNVIKSAIAAIMARNLSHHAGSHVLSEIVSSGFEEENEVLKRNFSRYLQHRMDFIAQITTEIPPWSYPAWFHKEIMKEFYSQYIFLNKLNISEGLKAYSWPEGGWKEAETRGRLIIRTASKINEKLKWIFDEFYKDKTGTQRKYGNISTDDFRVAVPAGILGFHAFYVVFEDFIRNEARHSYVKVRNVLRKKIKDNNDNILILVNDTNYLNEKIKEEVDKIKKEINERVESLEGKIKQRNSLVKEKIEKIKRGGDPNQLINEICSLLDELKKLEEMKKNNKTLNKDEEELLNTFGNEEIKRLYDIKKLLENISNIKKIEVKNCKENNLSNYSVILVSCECLSSVEIINKILDSNVPVFVCVNELKDAESWINNELPWSHLLSPQDWKSLMCYLKLGDIDSFVNQLTSIPLRVNIKIEDVKDKNYYWITIWSDIIYKDFKKQKLYISKKGSPSDHFLVEIDNNISEARKIEENDEEIKIELDNEYYEWIENVVDPNGSGGELLNILQESGGLSLDDLLIVYHKINYKLEDDLIDDLGMLKKENWGIAEMKISAGFLQTKEMKKIGLGGNYFMEKKITNFENVDEVPYGIIKAIPVTEYGDEKDSVKEGYYLGYKFWVRKPKDVMYVNGKT